MYFQLHCYGLVVQHGRLLRAHGCENRGAGRCCANSMLVSGVDSHAVVENSAKYGGKCNRVQWLAVGAFAETLRRRNSV